MSRLVLARTLESIIFYVYIVHYMRYALVTLNLDLDLISVFGQRDVSGILNFQIQFYY